jgi:hypothetical protein
MAILGRVPNWNRESGLLGALRVFLSLDLL